MILISGRSGFQWDFRGTVVNAVTLPPELGYGLEDAMAGRRRDVQISNFEPGFQTVAFISKDLNC